MGEQNPLAYAINFSPYNFVFSISLMMHISVHHSYFLYFGIKILLYS